ncbi:hypothetical protein [Chryseobacterium indologenes]|uniref:hypothetical protein n=2 Tax=Chryseobacterium indologenes TaxID=253 RepID=UPI0016265C41|nr:hypothetical protein [Chryseobacterium indologenes]MBF6644804.1 hypothetical protein [Chryseobacterium indologenes]MEB4763364.1 hypothetical protein [Chryseobacterium indologenes]QQQ71505.1 hypothetical protein JHW31_01915 [Chryseobacterium indologenes]
MRKIILIQLLLIIISCHSQEKDKGDSHKEDTSPISLNVPLNSKRMQTQTTEEFTLQDVTNYKKNKKEGSSIYEYVRGDGARVTETDSEMILFSRHITPANSLFTVNKEYHPNRKLWTKYETFGESGFIKGNKYEYDEQGKLIKIEDWDKPYKFTWEQVKKYIEQDLKLNIQKDKVEVNNFLESPDYNFPIWTISYNGQYKDDPKKGIIRIILNGVTGELLLVERQLGKGGDGTSVDILYKKKN